MKSTCSSCKGPRFLSQHLHSGSQCSGFQFQGIQLPLLASSGTRHAHGAHSYMLPKHLYTYLGCVWNVDTREQFSEASSLLPPCHQAGDKSSPRNVDINNRNAQRGRSRCVESPWHSNYTVPGNHWPRPWPSLPGLI